MTEPDQGGPLSSSSARLAPIVSVVLASVVQYAMRHRIAVARTMPSVPMATTDCHSMSSFAVRVSGIVSVGENATWFVDDTYR